MRVLFALVLLMAVGVLGGEDKMMREAKKWMKMKAMESCLGEDVVKAYMIKMKKAASKCSGKDAPELELPMFNNPYKLVTSLTSGKRGPSGTDSLQKMMAGFLRLQMLQEFSDSPRGFDKRDADDDVFELGERLQEKLRHKKAEWEDKIGNMTCMLQECGVLDASGKFNLEKSKRDWKEMAKNIDPWLNERLEWGCDQCEKLAKNIPEEMLKKSPFGPEMCKVKMYKECMKKIKIYNCMKFDMKKKLEKHFGDVDELAESTNMTEDQLFMAVKGLLKGPEQEFM